MKATKILFPFLLIVIGSTLVKAQNYHLIYETDIFSISLKQAAEGKSESSYSIEKGYQHILSFKDKKAINFQHDTILTNIDSIWTNYDSYKSYLVIDRKKTRFQWVMALYNKKVKKVYVNNYNKKAWLNIDPLSPPVYDEGYEFIHEAFKSKLDSLPKWKAPELTYTELNKEINGYSCKNVIVVNGQREYNVWYTEEINFNWCFDDYRFLIPGTVVLIEKDSKTTFELLSVKPLDYNNLPVMKEVVYKLLKLK